MNFATGEYKADVGSREAIKEERERQKRKAQDFFTSVSRKIQQNDNLEGHAKKVYDHIISKLQEVKELNRQKTMHSVLQHSDPFENLDLSPDKQFFFSPMVFPETQDKRHCMTMHQPWASLLIQGFKRVEGRQWTTEHRGPLWIHASARRPTDDEVLSIEAEYREIYKNSVEKPLLPDQYPSGVLLGRVELTDVMENEIYQESRDEYSESSECRFVFIVKNPMKLLVPIKMQGNKKIYYLDHDAWDGAKRGLRRVYTDWWPPEKPSA